ncbi:MAG: hypothetical protein AMJ81_10140 [Phycisphaerae bacterium SM23_33]|nr:MAG: hypothetical protein AMJ81_10140 [Phycisphaerae bacterium SM23_33]
MSAPADGQQYSGAFRVATYFPAGAVTELLSRPQQLSDAVAGLKAMQAEHVFLELYRGGHEADEAVLARARDAFRQAGVRVGGGLTTTWGEGFGGPALPQPQEQGSLFCYSHPRTAEDISRLCALAGRLFDHLMLDDFFFTNCECGACRAAKADGPWSAARNRLLVEFAAKAVLRPAHRANPGCQVIIKYPQWYDRFQQFGYDAAAQTRQFDAIWVGTETRDPHAEDQFGPVQQAQSWSVYRWLADLAGAKTLGGWFDPYGCDEPSYLEQGYQTVLVGTPEMLLFNYHSLHRPQSRPLLEALMRHMPRLRRWAAALRDAKPTGLACYKPPNSTSRGEYYVFDYLTMLGIPTTMHAGFPQDARVVFLSGHALADEDVLEKARRHLAAGRSLLASAEFVAGLPADAAEELFGLRRRGSLDEGPAQSGQIRLAGAGFGSERPVEVAGVLEAAGAEVLLSWGRCEGLSPYFTRRRHGAASAMMLDIQTNALGGRTGVNITRWVNVVDLPQPVLDCIRAAVIEPLGLEICCPGRVGIYCFDGGPLAVCNYRNEPADVEIKSASASPLGPLDRLAAEQDTAAAVEARGPDLLKLHLPPRSRHLLAAG